jgi:hypothetical protein
VHTLSAVDIASSWWEGERIGSSKMSPREDLLGHLKK